MLEIVFSDSIKASLRLAMNYNQEHCARGAFLFIGAEGKPGRKEKKEALRQWREHCRGQAVGGHRENVVHIGHMLDVGAIAGDVDGESRRETYARLWETRFSIPPEDTERFWANQRQDYEKLIAAGKAGDSIRIWASNAPYSVCGLYYVCHLLRAYDCPMSVIALPQNQLREDGTLTSYADWGDVPPGQFYSFLPLETLLPPAQMRNYADRWEELVRENAPLRTSVHGRPVSVAEDFYDPFIIERLPAGEFHMARFIGSLLSQHPLRISDSWFAYRIDAMIRDGRLTVLREDEQDHPYSKILTR